MHHNEVESAQNLLSACKNRKNRTFLFIYPAIFIIALFLYTKYNNFPEDYHPDEDRKIHQVRTGEYDFRHPELLLDTARLVVFISGGAESDLDYCIRGRWASAILASLAVIAFMGAAHILCGRYSAVAAGITVALCPMLLQSAHYMKEDTALVFGISCVVIAIAFLKQGLSKGKTILLGAACATAASGKYIGIFMIIPALIALMIPSKNVGFGRLKRLAFFISSFIVFIVLIDYEAMLHPSQFFYGLHYETEHVSTSHRGLIFRRFGGYYPKIIGDVTNDIVIVLVLFYAVYVFVRWKYKSGIERLFTLLPIGYYSLISSSTVQSPRYVIPVVVLIYWLGGMGAGVIIEISGKKKVVRYVTAACVYAVLIIALGTHSVDYLIQFKNDSRREFEKWVRENMSADANILQDWYVSLPENLVFENEEDKSKIHVKTMWFAGNCGSLQHARNKGFTHVAVSAIAYERFFESNILPSENSNSQFHYWKPRQFYAELFEKGILLWESKQNWTIHGFTNPVIRFYDIREKKNKIYQIE